VITSVDPLAKSVTLVELPDIAEGEDFTDWKEAGGSAEDLEELIESAEPIKPGDLFEESDLLSYDTFDAGNARRVLRLYKDRIRFTGGYGWLFYDDRRGYWLTGAEAEAQVNLAIEDTLYRTREIAVKARNEKYEHIIKNTKPTTARKNSTRASLKDHVTRPETEFGNPPGLLNANNCVIDLHTGASYPHHPSYGFLHSLGVTYRPGSRSDLWESFLEETVPSPEISGYLQELIGYTFTGEVREEILGYITGPKRSGKGTFTETLQALGEPMAIEVPIGTFLDKQNNRFAYAGLEGARFVHASESKPEDWLDSSRIKALSGGNSIAVEYKGKDRFTLRPQFTVFLSSNEPPRMRAEDSAAWYRLKVIEFPYSKAGREDKRLKARLREPDNLSAVLSWIVDGAVRWYSRDQGLETPSAVAELTQGFRDALDYIGQFIEDHYLVAGEEGAEEYDLANWESLKTAGFYIPVNEAYDLYRSWYEPAGAPDLKKATFGGKIRARLGGVNAHTHLTRVRIADPITGEKKRTRVIAGIRPRSEPPTLSTDSISYDSNPL
jgi:putative DNA primase/helicase